VGKRLRLHTVLAFISVVGGLLLFGAAGLILGPVTLTVTAGLLDVWHQRAVQPVMPGDAEALGRFENEGGALARPTAAQP
jgi:predicted PurR-regulated permease PerM